MSIIMLLQLPQYNVCQKGKCVKKPNYCENNKHCKVMLPSASGVVSVGLCLYTAHL